MSETSSIRPTSEQIEAVARAIWGADDYVDEKATWDELDRVLEQGVTVGAAAKENCRRLAVAAIEKWETVRK